jgi:DNA mismatch endonuclease, patch repair protein
MDALTADERSRCMASIRSENTKPEIVVRRLAHSLGYRFRLHRRDLPGTPDLVFPGRRCVVNVHGCFWHMHDCGRCHVPATRRSYWLPKLRRNRERDQQASRAIRRAGWRMLVIWECQTRNLEKLAKRLRKFLR